MILQYNMKANEEKITNDGHDNETTTETTATTSINDCIINDREMKDILSKSQPCKTRKQTVDVLQAMVTGGPSSLSTRLSNVHGMGPLLVSDIPFSCLPTTTATDENNKKRKKGVILGIDEAGRGPVLGPMTYAAAYWHPNESETIPSTFNDSKQLSAMTRSKLFQDIQDNTNIGFVLRVLHASELSRNMTRAKPYNLNAMSHDAAIQMIHAVLDAGVTLDTCYIDTVGIAESYQRKLELEFAGLNIKFVVETKADANYAPCSAASVVAKVSRDRMLETWAWSEGQDFEPVNDREYGSGYPSDPKCKEWLENNFVHDLFGFPDFVRFSWGPAKLAVKEKGVEVKWQAEEEDDENASQMKMNAFLQAAMKNGSGGESDTIGRKRKRFQFFDNIKLSIVDKMIET